MELGSAARLIWRLAFAFLVAVQANGQTVPPPNDNFADRAIVEGEIFQLKGPVGGATLEEGEKEAARIIPENSIWSSVWYAWRAPQAGMVLVTPKTKTLYGLVTISTGGSLSEAQRVENVQAEVRFPTTFIPNRYGVFRAEAQTEYQIRLAGGGQLEVDITLTNLPIIFEHPRSRTVSPGGTAFFSVGTAMYQDRLPAIQWQHNGTNLPNRTGPVLAFTNVFPDTAGAYQAVATSPDGNGGFISRTSRVAQLMVKEASIPVLRVERLGGGIYLNLNPEPGRFYNIRPLKGFDPGGLFTRYPQYGFYDEMFPIQLGWSQFARDIGEVVFVEVWEPVDNICDLNLRKLDYARHRIACDQNMSSSDIFRVSSITPYIPEVLECPDGWAYSGTEAAGSPMTFLHLPWCAGSEHDLGRTPLR